MNSAESRKGLKGRRLAAAASLIIPSLVAVAALGAPAGATTTTTTTITTEGETTYVVPANVVSLQVTVIGAAGQSEFVAAAGRNGSVKPLEPSTGPGTGAKLLATIPQPTAGTTLYAEVGSVGGGGGSDYAGAGGGASALQTCSVSDASCLATGDPSTDPRLLVAGGGGGQGETYPDPGGSGGNAGAAGSGAGAGGAGSASGAASAGGDSGLGGTAGLAGAESSDCVGSSPDGTGLAGTAGSGGYGGNANNGDSGSGGGGGDGWFGGGGGGAGACNGEESGAGGGGGAGSSYAEASATGVSLSTTTDPAEVVIVATIGAAPVITSPDTATFPVGTPSSFTVTSTCDPAALLSVAGTLPNGVTFVDNGNGTGTISGSPTQGGTYTFTITASGCAAPNAVQTFSLVVPVTLAQTGSSLLAETVIGAGLLVLAGLLLLIERRRRRLEA